MKSHYARLLLLTALTLGWGMSAHAQSRVYAGGAATFVTQTHPEALQLGGTTWGGSVLFGVPVSPRLSVEFEPSFVGSFDGEYTYSASITSRARVVMRRRDTFYTFQLRARTGFFEPVVGFSYVRGRSSRDATFTPSGRPYFADSQSENAPALAGGIDASVKLASRFFLVPTFRAFVVARPDSKYIGEQTRGGPFVFRYGVGARVAF